MYDINNKERRVKVHSSKNKIFTKTGQGSYFK